MNEGPSDVEGPSDTDGWVAEPGVDGPAEKIELHDLDLLHELNHPTRSRILRNLRQPRTAAELAELLDVPVTRLYHHINRLESLGFIRVVATRRVAAVTERRYQVGARSWGVGRDLIETSDRRELAIALGSLFDVSKLAFQRHVESAGVDPDDDETTLLSLGKVSFSEPRRREFVQRLSELTREFTSDVDDDDPAAVRTEVFIAVYPETA